MHGKGMPFHYKPKPNSYKARTDIKTLEGIQYHPSLDHTNRQCQNTPIGWDMHSIGNPGSMTT